MKTKLAQIAWFANKINPHYKQMIYFVMLLAGFVILRAPSDGGTGPF